MSASSAQTSASTNAAGLQALMSLENEALDATDIITLRHIAVNRPRSVIQAGHIFWVSRHNHKIKIDAISSQSKLDRTTPFVQWMTRQLSLRARQGNLNELTQWKFDNTGDDTPFSYPFTQALFVPFASTSHQSGLLFTRDHPFKEVDKHIAQRLAKIFGMSTMTTKRKKHRDINISKRLALWGGAALLAALMVIPVPMTTLAPAEIVAGEPYMITAPFDGVIDDILVPPNTSIQTDTPLLRFVDTAYRNEFILAEREEAIADAKLRQAAIGSFISETAKRNITIAEAEKALAHARQDYAQDRLAKTILTSPKTGLAIYSDPADWRGRHVTTGEAIIRIADPSNLRLRIEAPLSMGESLNGGSRIKLFLDNEPLNTLEAELVSASYYAKPMPDGHMAYEAYADLKLSKDSALPRIGTRGIAKVYGKKASLGYWLFRRPITLLRQSLGI